MTPIKSSTNKESCSPISSNCVIWQGPNLPCINLCNGDSVSDVVYKLAEELCDLKEQLNLTDLDLKCLVNACITCPQPQKTLEIVLQLLIDKVCDLQDLIDIANQGNEEQTVRLAPCFIADFTDSNGDITNPVPISNYVQAIAQKVCGILLTIDGLQLDITSINNTLVVHDTRIDILEQAGQLQVTPICSSPSVLKDIDVAFDGLEAAFCQLRGATGTSSDLLDVIEKECQPVAPANTITSLIDPTVVLWTTGTSVTLADTLSNMWKAICDLRGAVSFIQDTCCQVSCDDIIVDFDVVRTTNDLGNPVIQLFFYPKTTIPDDWYDCNQSANIPGVTNPYTFKGNTVTITDTAGHKYQISVPLRKQDLTEGILPDFITSGGLPYEIVLSASPLDLSLDWTITADICVTNGTTSCVKCISVDAPYVPTGCCTITATDTVTIVYKTCVTAPLP